MHIYINNPLVHTTYEERLPFHKTEAFKNIVNKTEKLYAYKDFLKHISDNITDLNAYTFLVKLFRKSLIRTDVTENDVINALKNDPQIQQELIEYSKGKYKDRQLLTKIVDALKYTATNYAHLDFDVKPQSIIPKEFVNMLTDLEDNLSRAFIIMGKRFNQHYRVTLKHALDI